MSKSMTLSQISFFMLACKRLTNLSDTKLITYTHPSIYVSMFVHLICVQNGSLACTRTHTEWGVILLSAEYLSNDMGNDNCDSMTKFGRHRHCHPYQRMTRYYRNKSDTIFFFLPILNFIVYSKMQGFTSISGLCYASHSGGFIVRRVHYFYRHHEKRNLIRAHSAERLNRLISSFSHCILFRLALAVFI